MMQLHVSGRLVRDPAQKTSAGGRAYVHALMTASSGDGEVLITVMVFDTELGNLLATLRKGDSLSAIGTASIRAYADKGRETRRRDYCDGQPVDDHDRQGSGTQAKGGQSGERTTPASG